MTKSQYISIIFIVLVVAVALALLTLGGEPRELVVQEPEITTNQAVGESVIMAPIDGTYTINPASSTILWSANKKLIKDYTDRGTIAVSTGTITFEEGQPVVGSELVVDMTSIEVTDTGVGGGMDRLEEHLASDDFFSTETHPEATFVVTSVDATEAPNAFDVTGDLTIKGITSPAATRVYVEMVDETTATLSTTLLVDRTTYDVRFGSDRFFDNLGDNVIEDTFVLDITLVATQSVE